MKFRNAKPKDIKRIQKMISEGFELPQVTANALYPAKKLKELFKLRLSFVLTDKNKVVAAACAFPDRENHIVAWGDLLVVDPKYHRNRIGTKVIEHQQNLLKSKGFIQLILYTEKLNPEAMKFYEKLGFAKVGEVDFLPFLDRVYYKKILNQKGVDKFRKNFKKGFLKQNE